MTTKIIVTEEYSPLPTPMSTSPESYRLTNNWELARANTYSVVFKHVVSGHLVTAYDSGNLAFQLAFQVPPSGDRTWDQGISIYTDRRNPNEPFIPDDPAAIFLEIEKLCRRFLDYSPDIEIFVDRGGWSIEVHDMEEADEESGPVRKFIDVDIEQPDWKIKVKSALLDLDVE